MTIYKFEIKTRSLEEIERYTKSLDMALALYDIQDKLRRYYKHGMTHGTGAPMQLVDNAICQLRDDFYETLAEHGIDLDRLVK